MKIFLTTFYLAYALFLSLEKKNLYTQMNSKVGILSRKRRQFLRLERATIAE